MQQSPLFVKLVLWFNTFAPPHASMGYMPYTTNPHLPRLRKQTANLVIKKGWSTRQVARHTGFAHSSIVRWVAQAKNTRQRIIPTKSSRPRHHPKQLDYDIVKRILELRAERQQCAEVLHYRLRQEGVTVSLSSVKRTLHRNGLTRYSKWKKWHIYPNRPKPEKPGVLVEIDSMFDGLADNRLCAYALIDVCCRWAYAWPTVRINSRLSASIVRKAQVCAPFQFQLLQSDHGQEFSKWFTKVVENKGIAHRHTRVRRPTDNGHVERFIRTLQQECLNRSPRSLRSWQKAIPDYIHYYNTERPHMGLHMQTPLEVVRSY
jgi:transposase InsO family protein